MKNYDHKKIEKKWQNSWEKDGIYEASDKSKKEKFYSLIEFPYPSGDGLHVGHPRPYIAMDIVSRKRRMEGYNVLYPIGWDAFGLPTENFAIKTGVQPALVTKKNTNNFRRQIKSLGASFDWSREVNTTDPAYYKWTQWIFLQFFKKGLAYKSKAEINWCPKDKTGLANEEVVDGCCERCGTPVLKKEKEQWMLGITKYAERLDKDLDFVDYPERVKIQQRNWIGKSEGSEIEFELKNLDQKIKIFTTRADTLFGAFAVIIAPEHELVRELKSNIKNWSEVEKYIASTKKKTDIERIAEDKEKTGIELKGIKAINPANGEEISVWIADFILTQYGTGAIFADMHDERDWDFAKKYNLPMKCVLASYQEDKNEPLKNGLPKDFQREEKTFFEKIDKRYTAFVGKGRLINSGKFNGMDSDEAIKKITKFVGGKIVTKFKLRDWVFSRQRYWGEPIPMIFCENCQKKELGHRMSKGTPDVQNAGWIPVLEKDLPVILPKVKSYQPTDTGESPLAKASSWLNTKCPKCGGPAKRETDTMPNWAGSSWYYFRYLDPKDKKFFVDSKKLAYWSKGTAKEKIGPVDWYNGGMEHTTLHLLYSRFWHKFLYDIKLVPTIEPYIKRTSHGMILGEGGVKMSKSIGNVVNPDDIVKIYGADTLRIYEMFMGPFEDTVAWSTESIIGSRSFVEKVWRIGEKITKQQLGHPMSKWTSDVQVEKLLNKTIKKVSEDIEVMRFNTAISAMMILANEMEKTEEPGRENYKLFLRILAPFTPHITEELWNALGEKKSIHVSQWPKWDEKLIIDNEVTIAVQVNGKVRAEINIKAEEEEKSVKKKATEEPDILKYIKGGSIKRIIYVKNRLINIVI